MALSQKTFAFLMENRFRNSRLWYQEHREEYQREVLAPVQDLVRGLEPYMLVMDAKIVTDPKVDKTISRVYRDTRFSKDKTLYREVVWLTFARDRHQYPNYPAFYFQFSPNTFRYGCGYYDADPTAMGIFRQCVLENTPQFKKAKAAYEKQALFQMDGDCYKRSKHPQEPPALREWLDRKNIFFQRESTDFPLLFSDTLPQVIGRDLQVLEPMYAFLCAVQARRLEEERSLYVEKPLWE